MNLSETVFVLPADHASHTARIRIFTPGRELPFAGHPTVGTAIALAERTFDGDAASMDIVSVLEETVGPVRCAVRIRPGRQASPNLICHGSHPAIRTISSTARGLRMPCR